MRTVLFLTAGLLLLASMLVLARLFVAHYPAAVTWAGAGFLALWLLICAVNMWVGVARAGYSVGEELPILLLNFAVPAAIGVLLAWKLR